jgi:subtilisin family serine protease
LNQIVIKMYIDTSVFERDNTGMFLGERQGALVARENVNKKHNRFRRAGIAATAIAAGIVAKDSTTNTSLSYSIFPQTVYNLSLQESLQHSENTFLSQQVNPAASFVEQDEFMKIPEGLAKMRQNQVLSSIKVGIIDTGTTPEHPQLQGKINTDSCDMYFHGCDTTNPRSGIDNFGHGTAVTGVVDEAMGGEGDSFGVVKVADQSGAIGNTAYQNAFRYLADRGYRVVNVSIGSGCGDPGSPALHDAVNYFLNKGGIIVMAAGNDAVADPSQQCHEGFYPQNDPNVISVDAVDNHNQKPFWGESGYWSRVAALGVNVTVADKRGGYRQLSGTSFAAPFVTGLVADMLKVNPDVTRDQIITWLVGSCDPAEVYDACGGKINFEKAIEKAVDGKVKIQTAPLPSNSPDQSTETTNSEMQTAIVFRNPRRSRQYKMAV